ncbi:MAP3K-like serine/threonine kinase [Skeletonema marinoi]|uniref:MAP3K-like serine/threonine kinase n=1 Tax=Skeletonema marinoi TaxID=267567 RepID=A0AAD9D524_9STRA|nr:MAP3K-like serine/threonine kinase [Skeletonema marinoi]
MKYLSPNKTSPPPPPTEEEEETINYVSKFERGIADLAMEARYLSVLSHENIVTLWFVSEGSLEEVFNCGDEGGGGGNGSGRRRRRSSVKHHGNNDSSSNSNNAEGGRHHHQHGYFLLLDALHETLHQRISHSYIPQVVDTPLRIYQTNKKAYSNNTHIAKVQLAKRLSSLKSIALALQYLHEDCNLIYRDIKPSNIGFHRRYDGGDGSSCTCGHVESSGDDQQQSSKCTCNYTDIPKLFDFGLAKELKSKFRKAHPSHSHDDPPTFKLTSATGSRRYMSPEVALREPYNHKADVYSFGMVVYQISALVVPFHGLAMKNHEQVVAREGLRPDVTIPSKESSVRRTRDFRRHYSKEKDRGKKILMLSKRARCVWPEGLNALITECWDDDMRKRPEMREVVERLDACIEELNKRQRHRELGG